MLRLISDLKRRVLDGQELTRAEALQLMALDAQDQEILSALEQAADEIRAYFMPFASANESRRSRYASGSISRSLLGASPTYRSRASQYPG